jgi:serine/threonine protein kinase/Tfp pilus assembly protein PilF
LEKKDWKRALEEIQLAAALDRRRYEPFPLNRYQPKRILGAGGFGTAFWCHDPNVRADVVVKTFHTSDLERCMDDVFREARILRKMRHPSIIDVFDSSYANLTARKCPYVVMDFFPGGSLGAFVHDRGTLEPADLLVVARQVAEGMKAAHEKGVLHRDLKPDNVLVRKEWPNWQVRIIEFGLAMRQHAVETSLAASAAGPSTFHGGVVGTMNYAPPEQLGQMPGVRPGWYSDVYSFGKLCLYGLFKMTEPKERHWNVLPAKSRDGWKSLLERCTEHDLEHRLASFEAVLAGLDKIEAPGRGKRPKASDAQAAKERRRQSEAEPARQTEEQSRLEGRTRRIEQQQRQMREEEEREEADDPSSPAAPPDTLARPMDEGVACLEEGEYAMAVRAFNRALKLDPDSVAAYLRRAEAHREREDYDKAVQDATRAIQLDPQSAAAYTERGFAYIEKKSFDLAFADFGEALRLDPSCVEALYHRAEAFYLTEDYERALTDLNDAMRLRPGDARFHDFRGQVYLASDQTHLAAADFTEAVRLDPNFDEAYCHRGLAYTEKGNDEQAVVDFTQAIQLDGNFGVAYYHRAWAYSCLGRHRQAFSDFDQAIRLHPREPQFYLGRGLAYADRDEDEKAIEDFTKALRLDRDLIEACQMRG